MRENFALWRGQVSPLALWPGYSVPTEGLEPLTGFSRVMTSVNMAADGGGLEIGFMISSPECDVCEFLIRDE